MATTITSNEGFSSSTPPDQIPSFTPEAYAEEQSFEQDLLRPSIEAEKKYQEEGLKIRHDNYKTIKKHTLDFDKFEPEQTTEVRNRVLVSGYIDSIFPEHERPSNDHDILRDSIANHKFNGAGAGDDAAFLEAMRGDFAREDKEQAFWDDLDRRATLSAMSGGGQALKDFKEWAWSDENAEFTKANRLEINDRWQKNQDAIREKFGVDMLHDLRTTFNDMGTEDQWLALAWRRTKDYSDEEKDLFIASLRDLATEYPSEAGNSFLANFGTSAKRGVMGALDRTAFATEEYFRNVLQVAPHNVFVGPWAENSPWATWGSRKWSIEKRKENEQEVRDWRDGVDWQLELQNTYEQDWDPVRGLAAKDTTLRAIEEGVYAMPGALTTSAIAFIPYVGMPLSFGTMKEFDREKYRREILANGGSREDAYHLAGGMSMVSAVPNMLLEKFQSYGLTGRIPGMGKVFGKIDNIFANKLGRFGTKMFVAGAAETTVELTQHATTDLVQDITNSLKEFNPIVPDIEWKNGEDGHFDGYFNKALTTFVAVAPLGAIVAGRGMSMESRAEAMKTASPLERKAFGITEEASAKLDEAKNPREMVEAFQNAVKTRAPWSETAQASVMELEEMQKMRTQTNEDAETFGVSPSVRRTPDKPTFEVFDRLTGDTLAEVDTAHEATEEVFEQLQMKEEENRQYFQQLLASFEAASLDVEQSGEAVEVGTGTFTDADAEAAMPGSDRRLQTERELLEQRDGGTGAVAQEVMSEGQSGHIAGVYVPAGHMGRKEAVTQIHNGSSVLTLIHERGHAKRRKLMESGAWTRADQISSMRELDNLIAKVGEKFLPENFEGLSDYDQEVALDEAVAELSESLALTSRKGKNSKMGGLIQRSLSAMVQARVPGAAQLKSFLGSMRDFFGLQLRRATIIRKAVRDGNLDQAQVDQLTDMLVGTNSQEVFEQEREAIPTQMVDGQQVTQEGDAKFQEALEHASKGWVYYTHDQIKRVLREGKTAQAETLLERLEVGVAQSEQKSLSEGELKKLEEARQAVEDQQVDTPFSTGKAGLLSLGNTTVTPNAETKTYPTKDGGVVGPASFSITAHHGTPHKVDKFSTKNIGTGEGAQAYGWGLYFAESEDVARDYKNRLTDWNSAGVYSFQGEQYASDDFTSPERHAIAHVFHNGIESARKLSEVLLKDARNGEPYTEEQGGLPYYERLAKTIESIQSESDITFDQGSLYTVDLNVEQDELLDWDKPMGEQSELVRKVVGYVERNPDAEVALIRKAKEEGWFNSERWKREEEKMYETIDAAAEFSGKDGAEYYRDFLLRGGDKQASEALAAAGIKGIRYLDGDSRSNGEGTSNYVIFNDADITITEENGQVVDTASPSFSITPADTSYRIQHQPSPDDATLNDLTEMFGEDIYGPNAAQYYGAGMTGESEVLNIFKKVRGNPEAKVTIYRVVPASADQINAGDWVTISKAAADEMNNSEFLGVDSSGNPQESKIISKVVMAKEVTWPGDSMQEQGYFPSSPSFSPGDARMLSDLSENVMRRVRAPEARAVVFEQLVDRIDSLKRDVAKMIFGGTVEQEAIPDARSMKSLKKEAAFRQAARHDELEMELDSEMRTLGADLAVSVKDMPVHSALIDGGYKLTTKKKALTEGRMQETDGDFDDAGGLHPSVFGGDTMPDVAAQALAGLQQDGQVILQEGTVSELYDALAQEWQQVQENRQRNKEAKSNIRNTAKQARTEANEWLEAEVAKQKKHYNPVARIRRSLVMYDAVLKTLPPELRGKMGGFVQIGKLNSDQKRLEFLEKKLEQLDVEVDKWISGKHRKQIEKIFKANRPKKKSSGQAKVDSNFKFADLVMKIEKLSKLTREEVEAKILKIDGKLETETDEAEIQKLTEKRDNLAVFGNIDGMKANALGDFYQNLNTIHRQGKLLKAMSDEQFNQFLEETISIVNNDVTGGRGDLNQSDAKLLKDARRKRKINLKYLGAEHIELEGMSDFQRKNISFEWLMNNISRGNKDAETMKSKTHERLSTMVHLSTTREDRANMETQEEYREMIGEIFGVKVGGQLSIGTGIEDVMAELERIDETNISKMEYGKDGRSSTKRLPASKVQSILNGEATIEALGISEADWAAIQARYAEIQESGKKIKSNTRVEYESQHQGKAQNMALSQSQALNLTMLWRQEGLKGSMEHEGYSEQTMKDMEEFLSPESKRLREWLTIKYEENYHKINEVFRVQNGYSLPKTDFYSPAVRIAQKEAKEMSIDSEGRQAMSVDPNFTITRTANKAPMDQEAGALSIYVSHTLQTNHYTSWADTVKTLRSVFSDQTLRDNIKGYVGSDAIKTIEERIQWFADGGNRKATHIAWMDKLRAAHTYNSLSFKWSIMVKQLTSLPAYAFDMGIGNFAKYSARFMKHPVKNMLDMWNTDYVQTRFKKGYERDVIDGLRSKAGANKFKKALQVGMLSGKLGDIAPVMIGGWIAREHAYDQAKRDGMTDADAKRKAEIVSEMVSDRSQQAGGLKDLSSFQGDGSVFKLFTMYKTSPRQYYANVYESGLDMLAGKKKGKTQFARRAFIAHMLLPLAFQFVSDVTRMGLRPDDEDAFSGENYLRAMLLGPLNGLFIAGDAIDIMISAISGAKVWAKEIPILGGVMELSRGGDFEKAADNIIRGIGKLTPGAFTFYDIITDEYKRLMN